MDFDTSLAWPLTIALAWLLGELAHQRTGLPRISLYGLLGFVLGNLHAAVLPQVDRLPIMLAANVAFGLILFEFGYRINLRWYIRNPWLGVTALVESVITFVAIGLVARLFGASTLTALLLASLAMATSPAAILRVINEQRSSGQVTERALHLTAVHCVLAVFAFKIFGGVWIFQSSGDLLKALSDSVVLLVGSGGLGLLFGLAVPALLRHVGRLNKDATVAFALSVMTIVAIAHVLRLSPILAALTFGLMARHRRVVLNQAQRNFGALGDLLAVVLFVYAASTISFDRAWMGAALGLAIVGVRGLTRAATLSLMAPLSDTTRRKGLLTALAMTPASVLVVLLLEHSRVQGLDLLDQLAPLAAATLVLELIGPIVTQFALRKAGETESEEA